MFNHWFKFDVHPCHHPIKLAELWSITSCNSVTSVTIHTGPPKLQWNASKGNPNNKNHVKKTTSLESGWTICCYTAKRSFEFLYPLTKLELVYIHKDPQGLPDPETLPRHLERTAWCTTSETMWNLPNLSKFVVFDGFCIFLDSRMSQDLTDRIRFISGAHFCLPRSYILQQTILVSLTPFRLGATRYQSSSPLCHLSHKKAH